MVDPIRFYSKGAPYGEFSNFAHYTVEYKGRTWMTSEHAFQAQKYPENSSHYDDVFKAKGAAEAARIGRDRQRPLRSDWEQAKDGVMLEVVRAKFSQHEDLKVLLFGTGDAELIEHTEKDRYWGNGLDGTGKNKLGKILMQVRTEFQPKEQK